jgi:hypothetical protein
MRRGFRWGWTKPVFQVSNFKTALNLMRGRDLLETWTQGWTSIQDI